MTEMMAITMVTMMMMTMMMTMIVQDDVHGNSPLAS